MAISLKSLRSKLQVDGWTGIAPASSTLAKGHRAIYHPDFVPAGSVVVTANRVVMDSSSDSGFTGQETLRMYFVKPQCDKETADSYWQQQTGQKSSLCSLSARSTTFTRRLLRSLE